MPGHYIVNGSARVAVYIFMCVCVLSLWVIAGSTRDRALRLNEPATRCDMVAGTQCAMCPYIINSQLARYITSDATRSPTT